MFPKQIIVCLIPLFLIGAASYATKWPCGVLLERVDKHYAHGWHNYIDGVARDGFDIADPIAAYYGHISKESLKRLIDFALENAAGHGSSGKGSHVSYEVHETADGYIEITIRNNRLLPLPATLKGKVFTPESPVLAVPNSEADLKGGLRRAGVPNMLKALRTVVARPEGSVGQASMEWRETEPEGTPKVDFVLRLPMSHRFPKLAEPLREEPGDFPDLDLH